MSIQKIIEEIGRGSLGTTTDIGFSVPELTAVIADTLFKNERYPQFDPSKVTKPRVEGSLGEITFDYDGTPIHIHIT